jgi:hypothetical protein
MKARSPPELQVEMEKMAALSVTEPEYFDLKPLAVLPHAELDTPARELTYSSCLAGGVRERLTSSLTVRRDLGKRWFAQR